MKRLAQLFQVLRDDLHSEFIAVNLGQQFCNSRFAFEITINYFARQYKDKHKVIISTYHHRLVQDHDFPFVATMKLDDLNTQVYEQKLIQYGGQLKMSTEEEKILHMRSS